MKRLFGAKKAGHTGCLDPLATGMLPLCFGEATKFSQFLLNADKTYSVTAKLGVTTNTGDSTGESIETRPVPTLSESEFLKILAQWTGEIQQVPPMFSALKHHGQPLYQLARQGITVDRASRTVTIKTLQLLNFEHDTFSLSVCCSKGTYIRTLIEDIGHQLGCGAHVVALRRTAMACYQNLPMYTVTVLEEIAKKAGQAGLERCLLPLTTAVQDFPAITLSPDEVRRIRYGQKIPMSQVTSLGLVQLITQTGEFIGMGEELPENCVRGYRLRSFTQ